MSTIPDETQEMLEQIEELEGLKRKEAKVLARLLDDVEKVEGHVLALRSEMGITLTESGRPVRVPSYTTAHTLRHIGNKANMLMGSEMDFMKNSNKSHSQEQAQYHSRE